MNVPTTATPTAAPAATPAAADPDQSPRHLADRAARTDLVNRLKRAEGQLRGVQRMIEEGQPCQDIASQMAAVRKALDSAYVHMTVCFMQQELMARMVPHAEAGDTSEAARVAALDDVMQTVQLLLSKLR